MDWVDGDTDFVTIIETGIVIDDDSIELLLLIANVVFLLCSLLSLSFDFTVNLLENVVDTFDVTENTRNMIAENQLNRSCVSLTAENHGKKYFKWPKGC